MNIQKYPQAQQAAMQAAERPDCPEPPGSGNRLVSMGLSRRRRAIQSIKILRCSTDFFTLTKAKRGPAHITGHMRQTRKLARGVWYEVRSGINNREHLLRKPWAMALFFRVFEETMLRFPFEVRGLRVEANRISFYIKPEDGLALPRIMQWMKEVFARRYNELTGRSGHIWGDRYWSRILEGEPPEGAEAYMGGTVERGAGTGVRPRRRKRRRGARFSAVSPAPRPPAPG